MKEFFGLNKQILVFFTIGLFCNLCFSNNNTLSAKSVQSKNENTLEFVASPHIKSVKFHRQSWVLSEPAIELRCDEKLQLSFDDISDSPSSYSYSIIHCDSDWNPTSLFINDYLDGFDINEIRDYSYSTGTIFNFMHCKLEIPNNDVRLKISGNYLIRIFNSYNPDEILLQRRFIIYESLMGITARVRQPSAGENRLTGQQIELQVNVGGVRVNDAFNEIRTVVCQNYLFQGCKQDVQPIFIRGNELDYTRPDALIFEGGNEFRFFDLKNLRYASQGIQSITYHGGAFHVQLSPDQTRRRQRHTSQSDLNGKFVVELERSSQSHIEADYAWVYFTLQSPIELDGDQGVYLFGELTGWQLSPDNRMEYNSQRGAYEKMLLLKQGVYNYRYLVANHKTGDVDIFHFEGSFHETENTYMVLVYYKPLGARYERIVGYERISTVR